MYLAYTYCICVLETIYSEFDSEIYIWYGKFSSSRTSTGKCMRLERECVVLFVLVVSYKRHTVVSFFWFSNPWARLDDWKTLKLHQLQQIMLVLFAIYIRKLIIWMESCFWSFNEGMNGITDAWSFNKGPPYNVCVGYSIYTFIKLPKSTFS